MKLVRIVLLVAAVALVGACGRDQDPTVAAAGDSTTTTSLSSTTTSSTPGDAGGGGFAATTVSTPPTTRALLADVKATHDGNVDRVTFTFEDAVPGYRIGYIAGPVTEDGSGAEVKVDGAGVLEVHFEPASGFDLSGDGRQVYKGPTRLDLATQVVLDVVRTGDFEANLTWVLGVDVDKAPFRVRTTDHTVVVEVSAPPA